jgi:hypothetical protein
MTLCNRRDSERSATCGLRGSRLALDLSGSRWSVMRCAHRPSSLISICVTLVIGAIPTSPLLRRLQSGPLDSNCRGWWCSGSACRLAVGHSPSAFLWPFAIRHSPSAIDSPQLSVQRKASPAVLPPPLPPLYLASPFPIRRCCRPSPLCSALQRSARLLPMVCPRRNY